ncbi:DUF7519 family protein [Halobacterium jilantaiense]|uniref:Uncharacterized protein n=1 Tax=Halobacterium jilantaiense TaxID=355548 RepID=A0A1I0Q599_9EURY|nr:hypothetical protein [Halobacterium jilantaiense]SEW22162.1 hypothetical protein SAMN04487945_2293 [Halobacterium jilantaiense]
MSDQNPSLAGSVVAVALATATAGLVATTQLTRGVAAVAGVSAGVLLCVRVAHRSGTAARVACGALGAVGLWVAVGLAAVAPLPLRVRGPLVLAVLGVLVLAFAVTPVRRAWTRALIEAGFAALLAAGLLRSVLVPVPVWYPAVAVWLAVLSWDTAAVATAVGRRAPEGAGTRRTVARHLVASVGVGGAAAAAAVAGYAAVPAVDSTTGVAVFAAAAVVAIGVIAVSA